MCLDKEENIRNYYYIFHFHIYCIICYFLFLICLFIVFIHIKHFTNVELSNTSLNLDAWYLDRLYM